MPAREVNLRCRVLLGLLGVLCSGPAVGAEPAARETTDATACLASTTNRVHCTLTVGRGRYVLRADKAQYLELTNNDAVPLVVDRVAGEMSVKGISFLEYCVYLGDFATEQKVAGKGEVGCASQHFGIGLRPIAFSADARRGTEIGFTVAPGESLFVSSNPFISEPIFTVEISVEATARGVQIWRQPKADASILCNGAEQTTELSGWTNAAASALSVTGGLTYAEGGKRSGLERVDRACLAISDRAGVTRAKDCGAAIQAGYLRTSLPALQPGETLTGQAWNRCPAGARWDWATYLAMTPVP